MKLRPKLRQIIAAEADLVSLVDRPANRIPFRIMKSEDGETLTLNKEDKSMSIDLGKIGLLLTKRAPTPPTITAMVVSKSLSETDADALVKEAGLSADQKTVTDASYIYAQADTPDQHAVVQLTEDVAVTITGLSKGFYEYDFRSTDFGMVSATNGFYPSLHMAQSALGQVVSNILEKSDNAGTAKSLVKSALSDFVAYANMLVDALPETAFKAELAALAKAEATRTFRAPKGIAQAPMSAESDKPHEVRTESAEAQRVPADLGHRAQTNTDSRETGPAELQNPADNKTAALAATGAPVREGTAHTAAEGRNIDQERQANAPAPRDVDVAELNERSAAENRGTPNEAGQFIDRGVGVDNPAEGQATGLEKSAGSRLEQMMQTLMTQIAQGQQDTDAKFSAMEDRLNKSEAILRGTVNSPAPVENTPVRKSASAGAPPLLDTAFMSAE